MKRYEVFTTNAIKGQYLYAIDNSWSVVKVKKGNKYLDFEIIEQFDGNILKLMDTPKRKFLLKVYANI